MNTGENVIFSLPVIDAALGLENIRSVICLGNSWTARRYPMTLHRHWPEVEKMLVTVDSFATPRALWHTDPEFRSRMLTNGTRSSRTRRRDLSRSGRWARRAIDSAIRSCQRSFLRGQHSRQRAQRGIELLDRRGASASRTAFGAWPGLAAKVVDGVSAISRRAAAATKVCDRQCGGKVSHR